jgi:hypothetical protein
MGWLAGLVTHSAGCGQAPEAGCSGSASASCLHCRHQPSCPPHVPAHRRPTGLCGRHIRANASWLSSCGPPESQRHGGSSTFGLPAERLDQVPTGSSPAWLTHAAQQHAAMSPGTAAIRRQLRTWSTVTIMASHVPCMFRKCRPTREQTGLPGSGSQLLTVSLQVKSVVASHLLICAGKPAVRQTADFQWPR